MELERVGEAPVVPVQIPQRQGDPEHSVVDGSQGEALRLLVRPAAETDHRASAHGLQIEIQGGAGVPLVEPQGRRQLARRVDAHHPVPPAAGRQGEAPRSPQGALVLELPPRSAQPPETDRRGRQDRFDPPLHPRDLPRGGCDPDDGLCEGPSQDPAIQLVQRAGLQQVGSDQEQAVPVPGGGPVGRDQVAGRFRCDGLLMGQDLEDLLGPRFHRLRSARGQEQRPTGPRVQHPVLPPHQVGRPRVLHSPPAVRVASHVPRITRCAQDDVVGRRGQVGLVRTTADPGDPVGLGKEIAPAGSQVPGPDAALQG